MIRDSYTPTAKATAQKTNAAFYAISDTVSEEELVDFILNTWGQPLDQNNVAALLEMHGIRDFDAQFSFFHEDVFMLAETVYQGCRARGDQQPTRVVKTDTPIKPKVTQFITAYVQQLVHQLPFFAQLVALAALGYSLGYYARFSIEDATRVICAAMFSFVLTGGFGRAIGRMGAFYLQRKNYRRVSFAYIYLVLAGLATAGVISLLMGQVNRTIGTMPADDMQIVQIYFVLFSSNLLVFPVLYSLHQHGGVLAATLIGLGVVVSLMEMTGESVYVAHWVGLVATTLTACLWIFVVLYRKKDKPEIEEMLPSLWEQLRWIAPEFIYGMFYFTFLAIDRLVAYSAPQSDFRVQPDYELGLIWAFIPFLLIVSLLPLIRNQFAINAKIAQARFSAKQIGEHNRSYHKLYRQYVLRLATFAGVIVFLSYWGMIAWHELTAKSIFTDAALTIQVFVGAMLGNLLLIWGLLNLALMPQALSNWSIIRYLSVAILINLLVGLLLSHGYLYWMSVFGFAAGALVFALFTFRKLRFVLENMDYHLYAEGY